MITILLKITVSPVLDRMPQAKRSFLNQIQQEDSPSGVLGGRGNDSAQAEIGQGDLRALVPCSALFRQKLNVTEGGRHGDLFQIKTQWVIHIQRGNIQVIRYQLLFLTQPQGGLTGDHRLGKIRDVKGNFPIFQKLQRILQCLFILSFCHSQQSNSRGAAI